MLDNSIPRVNISILHSKNCLQGIAYDKYSYHNKKKDINTNSIRFGCRALGKFIVKFIALIVHTRNTGNRNEYPNKEIRKQ